MSGHIFSVPVDHEDIKTSLEAPDSSNKKLQDDREYANSNKNDLEGNKREQPFITRAQERCLFGSGIFILLAAIGIAFIFVSMGSKN